MRVGNIDQKDDLRAKGGGVQLGPEFAVTQTTLSVDDASVVIAALKERFPEVQGPKKGDICCATQNRQDAVKALPEQCAPKEVPLGCDLVYRRRQPEQSAPEILVKRVVDRISRLTGAEVSQAIGVEESASFLLLKELALLGV